MPLDAACGLVADELELDTDPANLRRMYDRARTPESRYLNDFMKANGVFGNQETQQSKTLEAALRLKSARENRKAKAERKTEAKRKSKVEQRKE